MAGPSTPLDELLPGVAVPLDPGAGYGQGLDRGVCLGGGGLFFVAWQIGYLHGIASAGIDLGRAERVVGTSAGSLVATGLSAGHLRRLHLQLTGLARVPALLSLLAPAGNLQPSQQRAVTLFRQAAVADTDTIRAIGYAALAAVTPPPESMRRSAALVLGRGRLPTPGLCVTCVDAYTGQRCVLTRGSGVTIPYAVAASSAVPGLFAPQPVVDRRCMDGGVCGTGTHLDLLAGASRVLVLALSDGSDVPTGMMTVAPGSQQRDLDLLRASGAGVFLRVPEAVEVAELMAPESVPKALAMGARQAAADTAEILDFWS